MVVAKVERLCACGCGELTPIADRNIKQRGQVKGVALRYIHGHHRRLRRPEPPPKLCECGCGQYTPISQNPKKQRERLRFVRGHHLLRYGFEAEPALSLRVRSARRYARKRAATKEIVDRQRVWERDEGICGICGDPADYLDFHVDHKLPLFRGGEHSYLNVQVAHPLCNIQKGWWS